MIITRRIVIYSFSLLSMLVSSSLYAEEFTPRKFDDTKAISQFIREMAQTHHFDKAQLEDVFSQAKMHPRIIEAISRPAEGKPWYQYRKIFITPGRISGGVKFKNQYKTILDQADAKYGVPPEIVTAIVGVETRYGKHKGSYPVLDSLSTLAFGYPPRSRFFRKELVQYLLMTREEKFDPLQQKGSYAGAMGMPQFIPSSFRRYAVDFDGDGTRDLWDNPADVIGSVANYFKKHKWKSGQPVITQVKVHGKKYKSLVSKGIRPNKTWQELLDNGVILPADLPTNLPGRLLEFKTADGYEYWVGWPNFYAISRYNHSALYSLAVYQLSQEILANK